MRAAAGSTSLLGLIAVLGALAAATGVAGAVRLDAPARLHPPTADQIARLTVGRYFTLMNEGRGADFCGEVISSATLDAEGGVYHCAPNIDGYVKRIRRQSFASAVTDLHALFYMVADGIASHCATGRRCPRSRYGGWAGESAPPGVAWRTSSDPRLASTTGNEIVAVVDPRRSSPSWITLYYQAADGQILRASWSTATGSWRGSVVDTHEGRSFISGVQVLSAQRAADGSIVADVGIRVGTAPATVERFRLVREGGTWRADTWTDVTSALVA